MKLSEFTDNIYRNFKHPDGRVAWVLVIDCRFSFGLYKVENSKYAPKESTKLSIEHARKTASTKIRKWLRDGFIEIENTPAIQFDLNTNIIDVFRSVIPNPKYPNPIFNYLPVANKPNLYHISDSNGVKYLLCSDNLTKGISYGAGMRIFTPNDFLTFYEHVNKFTLAVEKYKEEILADSKTPIRKFPLNTPIGNLTHLLVMSPTTYNQNYPGTIPIGRSIWRASLVYDIEYNENDSVSTGEARGLLKSYGAFVSFWNRKPRFVFDLRYVKNIEKPEKDLFKVYEPRDLEQLLSTRALATPRYSAVAIDVRNYKGEIRRFLKNQVISESDKEEIIVFLTE